MELMAELSESLIFFLGLQVFLLNKIYCTKKNIGFIIFFRPFYLKNVLFCKKKIVLIFFFIDIPSLEE